jgi:hypothetical protein
MIENNQIVGNTEGLKLSYLIPSILALSGVKPFIVDLVRQIDLDSISIDEFQTKQLFHYSEELMDNTKMKINKLGLRIAISQP